MYLIAWIQVLREYWFQILKYNIEQKTNIQASTDLKKNLIEPYPSAKVVKRTM